MEWQKYNGEYLRLSIDDAVEAAILRETKQGNLLKVFSGTDSQVKGGVVEFATVIVFLRQHEGGFMFISKDSNDLNMCIQEGVLLEVQTSIDTAYQLCPLLEQYHIDLEVHADINTNPTFESHVALKDAMGYILGMGFCFKAKPESFASTNCANKLVQ